MTYRGRVSNGVVVLEGVPPLPDGTMVSVEPIEIAEQPPTIWDKLMRLSGRVEDLPDDAAANHDHYLYGAPKR
jgi:hypothetical protein